MSLNDIETELKRIEERYRQQNECDPNMAALEAIALVATSVADVPKLVAALRRALDGIEDMIEANPDSWSKAKKSRRGIAQILKGQI